MNPPPDFNRLPRLYLWMEAATFGPWLWWCRCAWLNQPGSLTLPVEESHALVLGDGDGRFTARLLRAYSHIRVDAVDASPAMLRALLKRVGPNAPRLNVYLADARAFEPPAPPYHLIVTHFFLDCLTTAEVQALAETIRHSAAPHARWLISEFAIPTGSLGRMFARPLVRLLYFAFGRLTGLTVRALPDHKEALSQSGFKLLKQKTWLCGLLTSELWTAVHPASEPHMERMHHA
jgi:ubiquinone/menaquinone biosynthesis C-methylase UbiE